MSHTPEPWYIDGDVPANGTGFQGWICASTGPNGRMEPVCHVEACSPEDIQLIAAAPDMAKALKDAYDLIKFLRDQSNVDVITDTLCNDPCDDIEEACRIALAKAAL
jgi:hypothetical protein